MSSLIELAKLLFDPPEQSRRPPLESQPVADAQALPPALGGPSPPGAFFTYYPHPGHPDEPAANDPIAKAIERTIAARGPVTSGPISMPPEVVQAALAARKRQP